jgi:hypothetical protein
MLLIKRAALPRPHEGALELLAEQFVPPWLDCGTSRRIRETEAEATAFVVCHAIGLETGSAASDYPAMERRCAALDRESCVYPAGGLADARSTHHGRILTSDKNCAVQLCPGAWEFNDANCQNGFSQLDSHF